MFLQAHIREKDDWRIWNVDLVLKDMEESKALTAFFALVFAGKTGHQPPQGSRGQWESPGQASVEKNYVRDHLSKMGVHKSVGLTQCTRVLRELAVVRPFQIVF